MLCKPLPFAVDARTRPGIVGWLRIRRSFGGCLCVCVEVCFRLSLSLFLSLSLSLLTCLSLSSALLLSPAQPVRRLLPRPRDVRGVAISIHRVMLPCQQSVHVFCF